MTGNLIRVGDKWISPDDVLCVERSKIDENVTVITYRNGVMLTVDCGNHFMVAKEINDEINRKNA